MNPHSERRPGLVLVVLLGSLTALDPLSIDMYLPAFPEIQRSFGVDYSTVALSLSTFFVGLALGQLVYGPLTDRFGRKRPLGIGMGLYFLSSLGCAFSKNIELFILFRVIQAFGGCSGMVISRAIVRDLFGKQRTAQIFSTLMLVMGLAPMLAPLAGGYLTRFFGWPSIFITLAGLSLVSCAFSQWLLPETLAASSRSSMTLGSSLKSYLEMFRDRSFIRYCLPGGIIRAGMFAYIAGSPFVFIQLLHVPYDRYGWIFGANALGLIVASQFNSLLLKRWDMEVILKSVILACALFGVAVLVLPLSTSNLWALLVPLFLFIASLGLIGPNSAAGALAHQGHRAGMASALYGALQWAFAFFSSLLMGRVHDGTSFPMRAIIAACGCLSLFVFWGFREAEKPAISGSGVGP